MSGARLLWATLHLLNISKVVPPSYTFLFPSSHVYYVELKSNSNIDVDPISSYQILPPPTPEPQLPKLTDHPAHSPSFSLSKPLKDPTSIQQLAASMYRKMYHYVVGSELLHPEESIFLCDEENTEDFKLKPEVETCMPSFLLYPSSDPNFFIFSRGL